MALRIFEDKPPVNLKCESKYCEYHRKITLTPLMINNQLSFNKFPRFDHMITQWNKENKKPELLRTVRREILSAAHKKCFIFSVSALPLHCGRVSGHVDNNVSVGKTIADLQRQYALRRLDCTPRKE